MKCIFGNWVFYKLQHLILNGNCFIGPLPSTLFNCKQLQILSMSFNRFTGSVPLEIGRLSMLTELYVYSNNFEGMFSLSSIEWLYIWMTSVTELICFFIAFYGCISTGSTK
jgi:hypothetical protein